MGFAIAAVVFVAIIGFSARKRLQFALFASDPDFVCMPAPAGQVTAVESAAAAVLGTRGFARRATMVAQIAGRPVVLDLHQRSGDGTIVSAMSQLDGSVPAFYVSTLLGGGSAWLETQTTDTTPTVPGELRLVVPDADLDRLLGSHDAALLALSEHGVGPAPAPAPIDYHRMTLQRSREHISSHPVMYLLASWRARFDQSNQQPLISRANLSDQIRAAGLA